MARYGRVRFCIEYVVDMDDAEMVAEAIDAIADDLVNVSRMDVSECVKITADESATEHDIEEFLTESRDYRRDDAGVP